MRLEPGADEPLLVLGLDLMLGEQAAELGVAGDFGRAAQLRERLLLDGVRVGQVLGQLLVQVHA